MSTQNLKFKNYALGKGATPYRIVIAGSFFATLILCAVNVKGQVFLQGQELIAVRPTEIGSDERQGQAILLPAVGNKSSIGKKSQVIVFEPLSPRTIGEADFLLNATATSGLPVSFSSSNPQVAVVEGNTVKIKGGGTAFLSASQPGNDMFRAAPMVIRLFTVNRLSQTIVFENLPKEIETRASPFVLNATSSSGLPVTFTSNNSSVIRVEGNRCTVVGTGSTSISGVQYGNTKYDPALPITYIVSVKNGDSNVAGENVTVLPKPVGEWMFIGMNEFRSGEPVSVEIIDSRKQSVIRMTTKEEEQLSVNVAAMLPGVYYLQLTQDEKTITSRFVKL